MSQHYYFRHLIRPLFFKRTISNFTPIKHYEDFPKFVSTVQMCSELASNEKSSTGSKFELKTPKGTKDYGPEEMAIREIVFDTITRVFKRHGAATIDTPVFELKEVLTNKYGEDSKLIYDLQDQGGELCSLRYDLTVPFARFLAMNKSFKQFKRYHIGKVYRRDQPVMTKGRFREFYQCDYDVAGQYDLMVPDAEVIKVMTEILTDLDIGPFLIKFNHRGLLDGIFEIAGVPADKYRQISSAVDKLDKAPWSDVREEMVSVKGLDPVVADIIGNYVVQSGGKDLLDKLLADKAILASEQAKKALDELVILFRYLEVLNVLNRVSFNLSLARGLDYYTGVIVEAVMESAEGVGSIAGGGRYDNLVGMFSPGHQIPCVGFSVGVERVFSILEAKLADNPKSIRTTKVDVLVSSIGKSQTMFEERLKLCSELWKADIKTEFMYKIKVKYLDAVNYCEEKGIPWLAFFGEDEMEKNSVLIKDTSNRDDKGAPVARVAIVDELQKRITSCGKVSACSLNTNEETASKSGKVATGMSKLSLNPCTTG